MRAFWRQLDFEYTDEARLLEVWARTYKRDAATIAALTGMTLDSPFAPAMNDYSTVHGRAPDDPPDVETEALRVSRFMPYLEDADPAAWAAVRARHGQRVGSLQIADRGEVRIAQVLYRREGLSRSAAAERMGRDCQRAYRALRRHLMRIAKAARVVRFFRTTWAVNYEHRKLRTDSPTAARRFLPAMCGLFFGATMHTLAADVIQPTSTRPVVPEHRNAVSPELALAIFDLCDAGYDGIALARDPATENQVVFRCSKRGCQPLAFSPFEPDAELDKTFTLLPLACLRIADGTAPREIFEACAHEIERLARPRQPAAIFA